MHDDIQWYRVEIGLEWIDGGGLDFDSGSYKDYADRDDIDEKMMLMLVLLLMRCRHKDVIAMNAVLLLIRRC